MKWCAKNIAFGCSRLYKMDSLDKFMGIFRSEKCEKMIGYDEHSLRFGGLSADLPGTQFSFWQL